MHLQSSSQTQRTRREPRLSPSARMWTVHASQRINGTAPDGERVLIPAGPYVLREVDDITYELHDSTATPLLTLRLSEVAAYRRNGVLQVDGLWP